MDEQQLRQLINKRLDESVKPDKIVFEVCDRTNMHWSDAEELVKQVTTGSGRKVSGKVLTLSITWSTVMVVAGFALTAGALFAYILMYRAVTFSQFAVMNSANAVLYSVNFGPVLFSAAVLGLGMMAGGWLGMRRLWDDTYSRNGKNE